MKILVLNGPNINMLGIREPNLYGTENYDTLVQKIKNYCGERGIEVSFFQSNHEGDLVDRIQQAFGVFDAIVMNPAAYTHTSVALLDALKAVKIPCVEVHISDVSAREDFRQISFVRAACFKTVSGLGTDGYLRAVDAIIELLGEEK